MAITEQQQTGNRMAPETRRSTAVPCQRSVTGMDAAAAASLRARKGAAAAAAAAWAARSQLQAHPTHIELAPHQPAWTDVWMQQIELSSICHKPCGESHRKARKTRTPGMDGVRRDGMGWDGVGWGWMGMRWGEMGWDGIAGWDGMG